VLTEEFDSKHHAFLLAICFDVRVGRQIRHYLHLSDYGYTSINC